MGKNGNLTLSARLKETAQVTAFREFKFSRFIATSL
jgi:hypothetical protein